MVPGWDGPPRGGWLRAGTREGGAFGLGHESVNSGPRVAAKGAFYRALFILVSAFPESHQGFSAGSNIVSG